MSVRISRWWLAAGMVLVASAATVSVAPLSASATATNKCLWYDFDIQPKTPGAPAGPFDNCVEHPELEPEASYYWTDETSVFYEPRNQAFDYSAFSQLNPFTGDGYSFRKANELFPTTPDLSAAAAKLNYAQAALGAKPRALESRRAVTDGDACQLVPQKYSDADILEGTGWLAPTPAPGGEAGTLTYSLASTLNSYQRSVILDALVQYEEARAGSLLPSLVEWKVGDGERSVITFVNSGLDPAKGDDQATARPAHSAPGRDGLKQWVDGDIALTPNVDYLDAMVVAHEILHVLGFRHLSVHTKFETMGESSVVYDTDTKWALSEGSAPTIHPAFSKCTKEAMVAAK